MSFWPLKNILLLAHDLCSAQNFYRGGCLWIRNHSCMGGVNPISVGKGQPLVKVDSIGRWVDSPIFLAVCSKNKNMLIWALHKYYF